MKFSYRIVTVPALLFTAFSATQLLAAPIPGLFNTGTDANNVALVGGSGVTDPHYTIVASTTPGFVGQQAVTSSQGGYVPNDGDSRWVSLSATGYPGGNTTTYRLTFNMTGLNAATASISGSWATDNLGTIFFNGVNTGITTGTFADLTAFSITSGFSAGLNTLDFQIQDITAPTAFRVDDLVGTAQALAMVPEPSSWALLIIGFGVIGAAARRTRRAPHARLAAA